MRRRQLLAYLRAHGCHLVSGKELDIPGGAILPTIAGQPCQGIVKSARCWRAKFAGTWESPSLDRSNDTIWEKAAVFLAQQGAHNLTGAIVTDAEIVRRLGL